MNNTCMNVVSKYVHAVVRAKLNKQKSELLADLHEDGAKDGGGDSDASPSS